MGDGTSGTAARARLARIVRRPDCDLAEAALLCCVELEPDLDVDAELLRLDALADGLLTSGFQGGAPIDDARALSRYLGGQLQFTGDTDTYHDPRNCLLTRVLDRRRGMPIALSILYVGIARRVGITAYGLDTPAHFLVGVGDPPVVIDPFNGGELLDEPGVEARIRRITGGTVGLASDWRRPAPPWRVIRRLLDNLTRDFLSQGDGEDALWTLELKRLLPGATDDDVRLQAELLVQLGRYRDAAEAIDSHLGTRGDEGESAADLRRLALAARARMN